MKKFITLLFGTIALGILCSAYRPATLGWLPLPNDSLQLAARPAGLIDPEPSYDGHKHQSWQHRLIEVTKSNGYVMGRQHFQLENYLVHQSEYVAKPLTAIFQSDASVTTFYTWLRPAVRYQWQRLGHHKRAQLYDGLRYIRRYLDVFDLAREEALFASDKYNYGRPLTTPTYAKALADGLHWGSVVDYGWLRAFVYRRVKSGVSVATMKKWSDVLLKDLAPTDNGVLQQQLDSNTIEIVSYKKGKRHGLWLYRRSTTSADDDAVAVDSGYYDNDKQQGQWRRSYINSEAKFWVAQFDRGVLLGGGELDIPNDQGGTLRLSEAQGQRTYTETDTEGNVLARGHMPLQADTLHQLTYYPKTGSRKSEATLRVRHNNAPLGRYRSWHPNGQLESEGAYAVAPNHSSVQVGLWQYYHANSQRQKTQLYDTQGYLRDSSLHYDTKGRVRHRTFYLSPAQFYKQPNRHLSYDSSGALLSDEMRVGTQLAGSVRYYTGGRLRSEGTMKNGSRDSIWRSYHPNGRLHASTAYNRGTKDGPEQWYDQMGQLMVTLSYDKNTRVGLYKDYHPNGQLHAEGQYAPTAFADDEFSDVGAANPAQTQPQAPTALPALEVWPSSPAISNTPPVVLDDGVAIKDINYLWQGYTQQGSMQGQWRSYHPNGNLKLETTFGSDSAMSVLRCYDTQGMLLLDIQMQAGKYEGSHHRNHANGKPALRAHFKSSTLEGPYEYYSPNGVLLQKGNCNNGRRTGTWLFRYPNGKAQMTVVYDSTGIVSVAKALAPDSKPLACAVNKGNGSYLELTPEGQVLAQGRLQHGHPMGPWRFPMGSINSPREIVVLSENTFIDPLFDFSGDFSFDDTEVSYFDSLSRLASGAGYLVHTPKSVAGSKHDIRHTDDTFNGTAPEVEDSSAQLFAKHFPNHAGYHYIIANAYLHLEQYAQAAYNYQRALALNKHYITAHLYLATIALRQGSKAVAEQHLQQYELLVAQQKYAPIPRWVGGTSFVAAQCHGQLGHKTKALYWLERAIRQDHLQTDAIYVDEASFAQWHQDPEMKQLIELANRLNKAPSDEGLEE